MRLTEKSDLELVLIAQKGATGSGWSVAERALAALTAKDSA